MNPGKQKSGSNEDMEIVQFSNSSSFNFGYVFFGLAAVISIVATFFFWSASNNVKSALAEKKSEKDSIIADITSPTYKDVEQNASDFKAAVTELKQVSSERYSVSEFLPELYKRITKDVQIKDISVKGKSELAFDGVTTSYRSVADLLMALRSWPVLLEVNLNSVSLNVGKDGQGQAVFSISAKIDSTKNVKEEPKTSDSTQNNSADDSTDTSVTDSNSTDSSASSTSDSSVTAPSATDLESQSGGQQ